MEIRSIPMPSIAPPQPAVTRVERVRDEARDAEDKVAAAGANPQSAAKAAASRKVAELKERFRAFKKLFAGDPKRLTHLLAQIARELRVAVKAYIEAGGSAPAVAFDTPNSREDATEADPYRTQIERQRADAAEAEAAADAGFAEQVRGLEQGVRKVIEPLRTPGRRPPKDQEAIDEALKQTDAMLDRWASDKSVAALAGTLLSARVLDR